ncbi:MAG: hypothetical protein P1V13_16650 [Rhizobiaceae bacterium]|nr:hypothetical protein [Rhizobiaceae bacterium]
MAIQVHAVELLIDVFQSLVKRRHLPIQAKVPSTTHRRGRRLLPVGSPSATFATESRHLPNKELHSTPHAYPWCVAIHQDRLKQHKGSGSAPFCMAAIRDWLLLQRNINPIS